MTNSQIYCSLCGCPTTSFRGNIIRVGSLQTQTRIVRTLGFTVAKGLIRGLTHHLNPSSSNYSVSLIVSRNCNNAYCPFPQNLSALLGLYMQFGRRDIMERYVPTPSQRCDKPEPSVLQWLGSRLNVVTKRWRERIRFTKESETLNK